MRHSHNDVSSALCVCLDSSFVFHLRKWSAILFKETKDKIVPLGSRQKKTPRRHDWKQDASVA